MNRVEKLIESDEQSIQQWWRNERFKGIVRPYTARQVASLRGTFRQEYASNIQAKKLWALLQKRFADRDVSFTFGALDPIQVAQMAKYLDTVYVSGWQSSSTASSSNGFSMVIL